MKYWTVRASVVGGILLAAALITGVYLSWDSRSVSAMSGCAMEANSTAGSSMESCPMGNDKGSAVSLPELTLDGSILAVNKSARTVSVKVELPVPAETVKDLSTIKPGAPVAVSIKLDGKGKLVVTKIAGAGGTVAFKITGIQCQACADRLQAALKGTAGVSQVTVTANPPQAQISFDPTKTNADALKAAIHNTKPVHTGMPFGVED